MSVHPHEFILEINNSIYLCTLLQNKLLNPNICWSPGYFVRYSVVIYGKNEQGKYLVADPWKKLVHQVIEPEQLLCAMTAAQMECDNLFFTLTEKR